MNKFLLILLLAQTTYAGGFTRLEKNNWQDILKMNNIFVEWPRVNVDGQMVAINNVCTTGNELKTITAVDVCIEVKLVARQACTMAESEFCRDLAEGEQALISEQVREEYACNKTEKRNLSTSINYVALECNNLVYPQTEEGGPAYCAGEVLEVNKAHAVVYDVALVDNSSPSIRSARYVLGYKPYLLPRCAH